MTRAFAYSGYSVHSIAIYQGLAEVEFFNLSTKVLKLPSCLSTFIRFFEGICIWYLSVFPHTFSLSKKPLKALPSLMPVIVFYTFLLVESLVSPGDGNTRPSSSPSRLGDF